MTPEEVEAWMQLGIKRTFPLFRKYLRTILEKRFGSLPDRTRLQIETTSDLARLEVLLDQTLTAYNLQEMSFEDSYYNRERKRVDYPLLSRRERAEIMIRTGAEDLMAEGRAQANLAKIALFREHAMDMIRIRFGVLPENMRQQIEAMSDLDELHTAFQHAATMVNLEDFHMVPRPTLRPTTSPTAAPAPR